MSGEALLDALLDALVPGDGRDLPAAGGLALGPRCRTVAEMVAGGTQALEEVLASLPADFITQSLEQRTFSLQALEAAAPDPFAQVVMAAYGAYYTDERVRAVLAGRFGYMDRPPQPEGHALAPFDPTLLARVVARGACWRPADGP